MKQTVLKKVCGPLAGLVLAIPVLAQCGAMSGGLPGLDQLPKGAKCPDMTSVEAIESFDWAANYKVAADASAKLSGGVAAAVELQQIGAQIDADLVSGCGGLAHDLGAAGDFKNGEDACKAAAAAVGDVKAKLGAKLKLELDVAAPKCAADLEVVTDCAAKCDATVQPGSVKAECEPGKLQGECSAQCEGSCDVQAGARCSGECSGKCDAQVSGRCGGTCDGKCDGKAGKTSCAGKCEGKCDGEISGSCSGQCSGSCKLKAKASCSGTCTGGCSVEMKAPRCAGTITPPKMTAECSAHCTAKAETKVQCTPGHVVVRLDGGVDAALQTKLRAALEKNLPLIVKVAQGTGERAKLLAGNVKVVVDGAQATVSGSAGEPVVRAQLLACVGAPFKGALEAAAHIPTNVSASVSVSVSVSASAGTK